MMINLLTKYYCKNLIRVSHFLYFTGFPELSSKEIDSVSKALEKDPDNTHANKSFGKCIFFYNIL